MPSPHPADVMPTLHSADAPRSIEWLTRVLGLREVVAHKDPSGRVVHGELAYGATGMVIIGDLPIESEPQRMRIKLGTASIYLVCDEPQVEATYVKVQESQAAGECELIGELDRPAYGGANFIVRDLDGHYWTVGSYRPLV
jgi:uncharacterized glyoxalase superfamily protein PhnB